MCVCVGVALLLEGSSAQAIIGGFTPEDGDRRFDAVAAFSKTDWFSGNPYWNNHYGNGTLIAPNKVIMARHLLPAWNGKEWDDPDYVPPTPQELSMSFRFRRKPDGSVGHVNPTADPSDDDGAGTFHHVTVAQFILAPQDTPYPGGGTYWPDLALAILADTVTHIHPMPIRYTCDQELEPHSTIVLAGWGREEDESWSGCPCQPQPHPEVTLCEAGTLPLCPIYCGPRSDRLKAVELDVIGIQAVVVAWHDACSPNNDPHPTCWCGAAVWDSGGAVLVESPECVGRLELVASISGVNFAYHVGPLEGNSAFPLPFHCPADLNHDGTANTLDLGILLSAWSLPTGTEPGCGGADPCTADLNCDGAVSSLDLGILLASWGDCTAGPGCGGSESFSSSAEMSTASVDDEFRQWVQQATLDELFEWLEGVLLPEPADGQ